MEDPRVSALEAQLFVCALIAQAQAERLDVFGRENAHLRVVAQAVSCPYGFRAQNGACTLGYPGCSCMDDLMWATSYPPATSREHYVARLERRLASYTDRARIAAHSFRSLAEGFERDRAPSKAAAVEAMADLLESPI